MSAMACVQCGEPLDCHDGIDDPAATPDPGDVSLCAHCGQLAIYTDQGTLRPPIRTELDQLLADPRIVTTIAAIARTDDVHQAIGVARRVHARWN